MNDRITSRCELIVGVLANLFEEPNFAVFSPSHKGTIACRIDGCELRIASVFLETSNSLLCSWVDLVNGVLCDCLESFESSNVCHFVLRTDADNAFLWAWILHIVISTYSSTSFALMRS